MCAFGIAAAVIAALIYLLMVGASILADQAIRADEAEDEHMDLTR